MRENIVMLKITRSEKKVLLSNFDVVSALIEADLIKWLKTNVKVDHRFYKENHLPDMTISLFAFICLKLVSLQFQNILCTKLSLIDIIIFVIYAFIPTSPHYLQMLRGV